MNGDIMDYSFSIDSHFYCFYLFCYYIQVILVHLSWHTRTYPIHLYITGISAIPDMASLNESQLKLTGFSGAQILAP